MSFNSPKSTNVGDIPQDMTLLLRRHLSLPLDISTVALSGVGSHLGLLVWEEFLEDPNQVRANFRLRVGHEMEWLLRLEWDIMVLRLMGLYIPIYSYALLQILRLHVEDFPRYHQPVSNRAPNWPKQSAESMPQSTWVR